MSDTPNKVHPQADPEKTTGVEFLDTFLNDIEPAGYQDLKQALVAKDTPYQKIHYNYYDAVIDRAADTVELNTILAEDAPFSTSITALQGYFERWDAVGR